MKEFKGLSDFFRNATDEEKHEFYSLVIKKANEEQLKVIEEANKIDKETNVKEFANDPQRSS
jgi:hypothetical protein